MGRNLTFSETPLPDLSGRRLGDYQFLRRLGQGSMAEVYLAQQVSLNRRVAIKILKPSLAVDANYVKRFHREAEAAAALVDANIVQIHEVGCLGNLHYIAQEYVPGQNLRQRLLRQGCLPVSEALALLRQVASALQKAGQHGIVHRDIKPDNILIGDDGLVKVADFGLAQKPIERGASELTQAGMTMGTPLYMSPEQIEGRPLDKRSDIYSLGVTAYHMLAGEVPFDGDTALAVALKHLNQPPPPLSEKRADVPPALCEVVHCMLEKDPANRYASGHELLANLDQRGLTSTGVAPSLPTVEATAEGQWVVATGTVAATRQLAAVLREAEGRATRSSGRGGKVWQRSGILVVTMGLLGAFVGVALVGRDPLAPRRGERLPAVPRKESPAAQYVYASIRNTEEAWRSVWQYFPPDAEDAGQRQRYYAFSAKKQLARWYLEHDQPQRALPLLEELAGLEETEREFRAFGLVGQAAAYARLGQEEQALDKLTSVVEYRDVLARDRELREQVTRLQRSLERSFNE